MKHWEQVHTEEMYRGMIYVLRKVDGAWVPLKIEKQWAFKEWSGCFSAI